MTSSQYIRTIKTQYSTTCNFICCFEKL